MLAVTQGNQDGGNEYYIDGDEVGPVGKANEADIDMPRESLLQFMAPETLEEAELKAQNMKRQTKASKKQAQLQDVLNSLLPPRCFQILLY